MKLGLRARDKQNVSKRPGILLRFLNVKRILAKRTFGLEGSVYDWTGHDVKMCFRDNRNGLEFERERIEEIRMTNQGSSVIERS